MIPTFSLLTRRGSIAAAGLLLLLGGGWAVAQTVVNGDRLAGVSRHVLLVNGKIDGSAQQLLPEELKLNTGAVVTGDLLVPGTPSLILNSFNAPIEFGGIVVGTGSASPTGYQVIINSGTSSRHLVTQTDPITMPAAEPAQTPTGTRLINLNDMEYPDGYWSTVLALSCNGDTGGGSIAIPPGAYGDFSASGNWVLTLGVPGATTRSVYSFQQLNINQGAQVRLAGPVEIRIQENFADNGIVGESAHPDWLVLKSPAPYANFNEHSEVYGQVIAPSAAVVLNALIVGQVYGDYLTLNANAELRYASMDLTPGTTPPASAPVEIDDITVSKNATPYTLDLLAKFGTAAGATGPPSFSILSNDNDGLVTPVLNRATGVLTLNFIGDRFGTANLIVRANDPNATSRDSKFKVTVLNAQQPMSVQRASEAERAAYDAVHWPAMTNVPIPERGWRTSTSVGSIYTGSYPNVWFGADWGWIYANADTHSSYGFWFGAYSDGSIYYTSTSIYPWLYDYAGGTWARYTPGTHAPRQFMKPDGTYYSHP